MPGQRRASSLDAARDVRGGAFAGPFRRVDGVASLDPRALEARARRARGNRGPEGPTAPGSRSSQRERGNQRRAGDAARRVVHFIEVKPDHLRKARERLIDGPALAGDIDLQALGHVPGLSPVDCSTQGPGLGHMPGPGRPGLVRAIGPARNAARLGGLDLDTGYRQLRGQARPAAGSVERVVERAECSTGASCAMCAFGRALCAASASGAVTRVSRNEQVVGSIPTGGSLLYCSASFID